jgi:UrcA family protein
MFATNFNDTIVRATIGVFGTAFFAGLCLVGATAPANAAETPRITTVSYSDLNISSAKGREALDLRILQAARSVCTTGSNDTAARIQESRCVRDAVNAAQGKLG